MVNTWLNKGIAKYFGAKNLFFLQRSFNLLFILFITFKAIGTDLPNTHPRYVTCCCSSSFISL